MAQEFLEAHMTKNAVDDVPHHEAHHAVYEIIFVGIKDSQVKLFS
jgi:hypothetical protein